MFGARVDVMSPRVCPVPSEAHLTGGKHHICLVLRLVAAGFGGFGVSVTMVTGARLPACPEPGVQVCLWVFVSAGFSSQTCCQQLSSVPAAAVWERFLPGN